MTTLPHFELDPDGDWFRQARIVRSPNFDARPADERVSLAVVHGISLPPGQYGGGYIDQLFQNTLNWDEHSYFSNIKGLKVSSHVLLERDGALVQYVPLSQRAWHAGQSHYAGRDRCNDFSVGIELEGCDETPYTPHQYLALASVLAVLMQRFPAITLDGIAGHCHIAPGRKTDPGPAFCWRTLAKHLNAPPNWQPHNAKQ